MIRLPQMSEPSLHFLPLQFLFSLAAHAVSRTFPRLHRPAMDLICPKNWCKFTTSHGRAQALFAEIEKIFLGAFGGVGERPTPCFIGVSRIWGQRRRVGCPAPRKIFFALAVSSGPSARLGRPVRGRRVAGVRVWDEGMVVTVRFPLP